MLRLSAPGPSRKLRLDRAYCSEQARLRYSGGRLRLEAAGRLLGAHAQAQPQADSSSSSGSGLRAKAQAQDTGWEPAGTASGSGAASGWELWLEALAGEHAGSSVLRLSLPLRQTLCQRNKRFHQPERSPALGSFNISIEIIVMDMPCKRMLSLVWKRPLRRFHTRHSCKRARLWRATIHIHLPIDIPHHEVVVGAGGGI